MNQTYPHTNMAKENIFLRKVYFKEKKISDKVLSNLLKTFQTYSPVHYIKKEPSFKIFGD